MDSLFIRNGGKAKKYSQRFSITPSNVEAGKCDNNITNKNIDDKTSKIINITIKNISALSSGEELIDKAFNNN